MPSLVTRGVGDGGYMGSLGKSGNRATSGGYCWEGGGELMLLIRVSCRLLKVVAACTPRTFTWVCITYLNWIRETLITMHTHKKWNIRQKLSAGRHVARCTRESAQVFHAPPPPSPLYSPFTFLAPRSSSSTHLFPALSPASRSTDRKSGG